MTTANENAIADLDRLWSSARPIEKFERVLNDAKNLDGDDYAKLAGLLRRIYQF